MRYLPALMPYQLHPDSMDTDVIDLDQDAGSSAFSVSSSPVIPERSETRSGDDRGLPLSYGAETLWLLARDPHSLFAYWDIDWRVAFGEETPKPRKVLLRVLNGDGSEQASVEVEPLVGKCCVRVADADAAYQGEIGYLDPVRGWTVVSRSETVFVPPEIEAGDEPAAFVTVPFHLSFQRLVDVTRASRDDDESLTTMLSALQERAAAEGAITSQQRELIRAIEEAAASQPRPTVPSVDLWAQHKLERIFGFGNSSLGAGFGGSSWA